MKRGFLLFVGAMLFALPADADNGPRESMTVDSYSAASTPPASGKAYINVTGSCKQEGIGLPCIDFRVTRAAFSTSPDIVTVEVFDPSNRPVWRTETELLGWQLWHGKWPWETLRCRLPPLSIAGRYTYKYRTQRQAEREGVVENTPVVRRMRCSKVTGRGKVNATSLVPALEPLGRNQLDGISDSMVIKSFFFWNNMNDGDFTKYKLQTDDQTTVTFTLPGFYNIDIWPRSTVTIVERKDDSLPVLGYRYTFMCERGLYTAKRLKLGGPPLITFNINHPGVRRPYARWLIWAIESATSMDKGLVFDTSESYALDTLGNALEEISNIWGISLLISGPTTWHVALAENAFGFVFMTGHYSLFCSGFPSLYALPRSTSLREGTVFNAHWVTNMNGDQRVASEAIFRMTDKTNRWDYIPSYVRALEVCEWGYQLAWLYGDLYVPGDDYYFFGILSRTQAPPEMLSRTGILKFMNKGGAFYMNGQTYTNEVIYLPFGTEWTGSSLGRYAFPQSNTVWVMNEDGTDCRQVAAVDSDRTIGQIAWSKDATRLAFTAWQADTNNDPRHGEVWTVKADGTDCRRLIEGDPPATNAFDDTDHPWTLFTRDFFAGPDFSPDGSQVAVQRYRAYEDRDTNDVTWMERMEWQDVETCLLPTAGGAPATVEGSEWSRYLTKVPTRITGPPEIHAPFSMAAAWSATDELLWPRSYEPAMTAASVYPNHGYANLTPFEFRFIYWDSYNQPPLQAGLWLDDQWIPMQMTGFVHGPETGWNDYRHGAVFSCSHTLPAMDVYTHSNHWMGAQGWNGQWVWIELPMLTSFIPVRDRLSNVSATLLNAEQAAVWGQYEYEFACDFESTLSPGSAPNLLVDAPGAAGRIFVTGMTSAGGTRFKKSLTIPLTYEAGQSVTNTIRYWMAQGGDPDAAAGPYTFDVHHTWPAKPWLSATGGVYVASSLSKSVTHTNDVNGDGTNEVVTITVSGGISATRGRSADTFLYRARYQNSHGLPATRAGVVIDGGEHAMAYVGSEGSTKIYEYETTLAANASPHQWQLFFADAYANCQTGTTNEPWVADAVLSNPTNILTGNREYAFRVQAQQTAGTGTVYCVIRTPQGFPRFIKPMTLVSGSLGTLATYELVAKPEMYMDINTTDGSVLSGEASVPAIGLVTFGYSFYMLDGFDRGGSMLEPMSALSGASSAGGTYSCYIRHADETPDDPFIHHQMILLTAEGDHVQRSPPGRGTVHSVNGLGCARGGLAWYPDGSRLAMVGGTNMAQDLVLLTNQGSGVFAPIARATNCNYAALSGWHTVDSVYAARSSGAWQFGHYDFESGLFMHDSSVGAPLPAANASPFTAGRFMSDFGPLNAWVSATPATRMSARCSEGEVEFGETNAATVYVMGGEVSHFDPAQGDTQPQAPEASEAPQPIDSMAQGPSAAEALMPTSALWRSTETLLAPVAPNSFGLPSGFGTIADDTPTLNFAADRALTAGSADDLQFTLTREDDSLVFANTLGVLSASGHVSYALSGSNLAVTIQQSLPAGTYAVSLDIGGLASAGGIAPGGTMGGWFTVAEGLGAAGGAVTLSESGVCILVPPGAFSSRVDFDIAVTEDALGDDPTTNHIPRRLPLAVTWSPEDTPATNLLLVFARHGSDGYADAEPVVAVWSNDAWEVSEGAYLSDNGNEVRFPLVQPGIYRLYQRPRTEPDLRAWVQVDQDILAPGAELDVLVHVRHLAGNTATDTLVRLILPSDSEYVAGTASHEGYYDNGAHSVNWLWTNLYTGERRAPTCRIRAGITNENLELQVAIGATNATERVFEVEALGVTTQATIEVVANLDQAVCEVTGPGGAWTGTGSFWRVESAFPGVYQAIFLPVSGYGLLLGTHTQNCTVGEGGVARFRASFFVDQDDDGLDDDWELVHAPDLTVLSGSADTDGDGSDDFTEWQADSNPRDPESVLEMTTACQGLITWLSQPGVWYDVQGSTNLITGFSTLTTLLATPPENSYSNPVDSDALYYRVQVPTY